MPAESFWSADDKIPISQTKIAVPSTNGLNYGAGQKIQIDIPATAGLDYFQPKESYLKFDVEVSLPAIWSGLTNGGQTRLQLDAETGGQVLIRDIFIHSGGAGNVLLEEIQNYNVLTALKYDYESNDSIIKKRALTEGVTSYDPRCRSTHGGLKGQTNNLNTNPYWRRPTDQHPINASYTNTDQHKVKCLLPLNTGIFSNDRVFPIMMTEGLRIEIVLEDANMVFRQLSQVSLGCESFTNPVFHSTNGCDTAPDSPTGALNEFFIAKNQNIGADQGLNNFPLVIGEKIGFYDMAEGREVFTSTARPHITSLSWIAPGAAGGGGFNSAYGYVKVGLSGYFTPTDTEGGGSARKITGGKSVLYSYSPQFSGSTGYNPTYVVSDVEMILQKVEMPAGYTRKLMSNMKEGGVLNYDFLSYTNYKYSQPATELVANIRLPLNNSRAKSLLMIPIDATIRSASNVLACEDTAVTSFQQNVVSTTGASRSQRPGLVGVVDSLQNYQMFYDGRLNPSRRVDVSKSSALTGISQQHLIELEKALVMGGITPFSFKKHNSNFCLGRALSLQSGVYDTRGKDFSLQLEYSASVSPNTSASLPKLWNCFCSHIRRIVISGDSIALEV